MLSQTSIHAIRALMYLAAQPGNNFIGALPLARKIQAPQNYLSKILQQLTANGLLESQRGSGGGIRLIKDANQIFLHEIVEPIEHLSTQSTCFMNKLCCGPTPCKHHAKWTRLHEDFISFLKSVSIGELVEQNSIEPHLFTMPGIRKEEKK